MIRCLSIFLNGRLTFTNYFKESIVFPALICNTQNGCVLVLKDYVVCTDNSFRDFAKFFKNIFDFLIWTKNFTKLLSPYWLINSCNINSKYAADRLVITVCHIHASFIPIKQEMSSWKVVQGKRKTILCMLMALYNYINGSTLAYTYRKRKQVQISNCI